MCGCFFVEGRWLLGVWVFLCWGEAVVGCVGGFVLFVVVGLGFFWVGGVRNGVGTGVGTIASIYAKPVFFNCCFHQC